MFPIQAVVFDLDDTLYAEREFAFSGFDAVAKAFSNPLGAPDHAASRMRQLFDTPDRGRVFHALLTERQIDDQELAMRMVETFRSHTPTLRLFADADAALGNLHASYELGILTDGRPTTQRAKIDALGLRNRVDEIIVTAELAPNFSKPHPRPFDHMSTRLQTLSTRMVYVADNVAKDFVAPNALGWKTVHIRRPHGIYADAIAPRHGSPQFALDSLAQLQLLLESL